MHCRARVHDRRLAKLKYVQSDIRLIRIIEVELLELELEVQVE